MNIIYYFKIFLISFSNIILSLPFTLLGLSKYDPFEIKADWQPPGYVFGIVWPILYILFGIINLRAINLSFENVGKHIIAKDIVSTSLVESLLQTLWLVVTSNYIGTRTFGQHFFGMIILGYLVYYCYNVRKPIFEKHDTVSSYLYFPYTLWIVFAFILNFQIVKNFIKQEFQ